MTDDRPTIVTQPTDNPQEAFQNATLRPVLKQQDHLLREVFRMFLKKRKVRLEQLPAAKRGEKIKELVSRDNRLRGLLFGVVIGRFTAEEMEHYVEHESDVNRRLTTLLTQRLGS